MQDSVGILNNKTVGYLRLLEDEASAPFQYCATEGKLG